MTVTADGSAAFAAYAYPPNELGYCGPPDASVLLSDRGADVIDHAQGFDGAWPYLEAIAAATGAGSPMDADVVHAYWVGGPLLELLDAEVLLHRLRRAMASQPCGLLADAAPGPGVLAHHSFHVFVVYPWVKFLDAGPATPLRILQSCRIRWGTVQSVDAEHAVIQSRPLQFDGRLHLGEPVAERVRWCAPDGTTLAPHPDVGATVAAHWDWLCATLDEADVEALAAATASTLDLVNRLRAR